MSLGSPPQVRGKPTIEKTQSIKHRITPAGAGKTTIYNKSFRTPQDHPRRCGENDIYREPFKRVAGSPPQVRGKRFLPLFATAHPGITPAGAGKTTLLPSRTFAAQDHPRRCGENVKKACKAAGLPGSPPQVRGKLSGTGRHEKTF